MLVQGTHYRTIWIDKDDTRKVCIIDQTQLPFVFAVKSINTWEQMAQAIYTMEVRGAGLIGAAGAFAMYLAALHAPYNKSFKEYINKVALAIKSTRPTAVNLEWAVNRMLEALGENIPADKRVQQALAMAELIADEDALFGKQTGLNGLPLLEEISRTKSGGIVNVLTHCNAGWLALVDYGTALAPMYVAHEKGIKVHVWVDETRPRNQGASLTAWELAQAGIPHTVIADNTGGLLMQRGMVDICIVGSDRTTFTGDVCNKIGTYLKALSAFDNHVPFYAAVYSSSFDWELADGISQIPIEERSGEEVRFISGVASDGSVTKVQIVPTESSVLNYGFDVTPARLITGLITERGICAATPEGIAALFPEKCSH